MNKRKIKLDDQVDANIGVGEEFWIQAIVLEITDKHIRVREIGADDEYELEKHLVKKA